MRKRRAWPGRSFDSFQVHYIDHWTAGCQFHAIWSRPEDVLSELRKNYALDAGIDGRVGEDLGVLAQVGKIAQSEYEGFVAAEGVDECLVRGEIHLELTEIPC